MDDGGGGVNGVIRVPNIVTNMKKTDVLGVVGGYQVECG